LYPKEWFRSIPLALDIKPGFRKFNITKHRGLCSFLKADTESEWFKNYRPGSGDIERELLIKTTSIDTFAKENDLKIDFLKLDTEGTEQDVLEGGDLSLQTSVMGVRASVNFQRCYIGQPLISKTIDYLDSRGFFLLNLDYEGFGVPRNSFFRKPDPSVPESFRYGEMISCDGVWMLKYSELLKRFKKNPIEFDYAILKYAYFAYLNNAPDVCLDVLKQFSNDNKSSWNEEVTESKTYKEVRKKCISFLGRWRVCEDHLWDEAQQLAKTIFNVKLEGGSGYWKQLESL
jgi:FkbM family methyltransferase